MTKQLKWFLGGTTTAAMLLWFPVLHATLVLINFGAHLTVLGLQLVTARLPRVRPRRRDPVDEPFVCIQVPAYNEPPEVLRETLLALSRLRWSNYEVLVIDNNTRDAEVWRPIEELCEELGPHFRFFHVAKLKGAKAGALNYARHCMDARAEFVFVVDADYVVERNALRRALGYFTDESIALVQFPQEYRNIGRGNAGLALDFKHFFSGYMNMANHLGCVPSTGTLSFLRASALRALGGFDTTVVTEDAELGFRLNAAGYQSLYVNEVIGRGLMPHDLESLKKQRWRWAFGNAQILRLNWWSLLFGSELTWRQKLGYLVHLTAWFNFNLIPSLSLVLLAPLALIGLTHPAQPYVVVLSWFTLATFIVMRFGTSFYSLRREGYPLGEVWLAFLTHLGLGWIFSASWVKFLFDPRAPFVRTNKFLTQRVPSVFRTALPETLLGIGMLAACLALTLAEFVMAPLVVLVVGTSRFLVFWVERQVRYTFGLTRRMQVQASRRRKFLPATHESRDADDPPAALAVAAP